MWSCRPAMRSTSAARRRRHSLGRRSRWSAIGYCSFPVSRKHGHVLSRVCCRKHGHVSSSIGLVYNAWCDLADSVVNQVMAINSLASLLQRDWVLIHSWVLCSVRSPSRPLAGKSGFPVSEFTKTKRDWFFVHRVSFFALSNDRSR